MNNTEALELTHEQRQRRARTLGQVVSCSGSAAVVTAPIMGEECDDMTWSIGNLVTIRSYHSRVIGFIRSVETQGNAWLQGGENRLLASIDLVGEIVDTPEGPKFQRGIRCYPNLGAETHRIRHADLEAIYTIEGGRGTEIGRLTQDESIPAAIDIESMLKRHFAIVGTTGVGKSTSVSIVVRAAVSARPDLRVLMIDPHNEFAAAFGSAARVLDTRSFDLPFWMLRFEELSDVIFRGRESSEHEIDFLREAIENARALYLADSRTGTASGSVLKRSFRDQSEVTSADKPTPFRLTDITAQIDEEMGKLESRYPRHHLKVLRARLREVADDPNFAFMFGKSSVEDTTELILGRLFNIPDNKQRVTIIQLGGIPSESVNAVVSVLARLSFDVAMLSSGQMETLMVCEEAHRYVPNDPTLGFGPTRRALARIAKEGRKYGSYLAIVTQRPGELDATILSQCSTVFAMRLTNDADQEIIRSAIADSSTGILAFLSSIGNREAIAFGEGIATPMRLKFRRLETNERPSPAWLSERSAARAITLREIVSRMRGHDSGASYEGKAMTQQGAAPQAEHYGHPADHDPYREPAAAHAGYARHHAPEPRAAGLNSGGQAPGTAGSSIIRKGSDWPSPGNSGFRFR